MAKTVLMEVPGLSEMEFDTTFDEPLGHRSG